MGEIVGIALIGRLTVVMGLIQAGEVSERFTKGKQCPCRAACLSCLFQVSEANILL